MISCEPVSVSRFSIVALTSSVSPWRTGEFVASTATVKFGGSVTVTLVDAVSFALVTAAVCVPASPPLVPQ